MIRPVRVFGDPSLREPCADIGIFTDQDAQIFMDLQDSLLHHGGIGFAAPQIGYHRSVFVVQAGPHQKYFVNPEIIDHSEETWDAHEGCLSIPIHDLPMIRRWKTIVLKYQDEQGRPRQQEFDTMLGRVIQHEYAHLKGQLMFDIAPAKWKKDNQPLIRLLQKKSEAIFREQEKSIKEKQSEKSLIIKPGEIR